MVNLPAFRNEPFSDFSDERNAQEMLYAIERVEAQLGEEYPLVIGGKHIRSGTLIDSCNPSQFSQVIGRVHHGSRELADQALSAAWTAFQSWKDVPCRGARCLST
jgi:1-pyrroline-5-carboxylate dehydrogenase